jgi:hypothetical protein
MAWSSVRTVFAITPFLFRTEVRNILKSWTASGRVATSSGCLAETSQTVSTVEIQLRIEIGEAWPSIRTVLLWRPDVFNAEASRHYGASGRLSKACPDGCTGTGCSDLEIAWNLHRHLLRNLWPYICHEMRHCPYYLKTLNRTDNHVKKQPLHKVFLSTRILPI